MTRLISRNARYLIRRDESSFWYIEDRTTGKVVSDHDGDPIVFIEASEAEDWIATHEAPGWGARKETT